MGKVVRGVLKVALVIGAGVLAFVPGVGTVAAGFLLSSLGAGVASAATVGLIVSAGAALAVSATLASFAKPPGGGGLVPFDPKAINPDKTTPRKIVFGRTPMPLDLRHAEPSADSKQEYVTYIFAMAAHKIDAVESLSIDEKLAWNGTAAVGEFAGYLAIETRLEAGPGSAHTAEGGTKWSAANQLLTGCATMKVRVKRSANSKSSQSPFASGVSGRWTHIGRGMPVYDPALDSTVPGGSGSQRATDHSTWRYSVSAVPRGNNPALQLLAYLLGWKINGVFSVGLGISPTLLNLPSFAAAAAICDESIALAAGGFHRRYEAGKSYTDADDPRGVMDELLAAMNGELTHDGPTLGLRLGINDLTPTMTITEDDFVSGYEWKPAPPLSEQYTVVRGRYTQPDAPALYGLVDYPEVLTGRVSVAPRPVTLELPAVQDVRRAERIATQVARMSATFGTMTVTVGIRGWGLRQNAVVALTIPTRGWTAKLFRIRSITLNPDATVNLVMRPEYASNYAWATSETGNVAPVAPVEFSPANAASWLMANIEPEADVTADAVPTLTVAGSALILADTAGVIVSGQLPRAIKAIRKRGDIDVSPTTTWSVATSGCTATIGTTGLVQITACTASGWVDVTSDRDGVTLVQRIVVTRQDAAAPLPGGVGSTTASTSIIGTVAAASYGTVHAGPLLVTAGSAGTVTLTAPLSFGSTSVTPAATLGLFGKWQWRITAGSWADVATEIAHSQDCLVVEETPGQFVVDQFGTLTVNQTQTGLTPSSNYEFRLLMRTPSGTRSRFPTGTATAVAT